MKQRLVLVCLALFVVLDVVLVGLAFQHAAGPSAGERAAAGAASGDVPTSAPPPTESPAGGDDGPQGPEPQTPQAGAGYVSVAADGTVLRSTRGSCRSARPVAAVAVSTDRGRTFSPVRVAGLREVLRVQADARGRLHLVGLDGSCRLGVYTGTRGGSRWTHQDGAGGFWHLAGSQSAHAVYAPEGRRATPCAPRALSTIEAGVIRLLCDDGHVLGTTDGGRTWEPLGSLDGAVGIRFLTPARGLAIAGTPECAAQVLTTTDGGTRWTPRRCLGDAPARAIGAEGDLAAAWVADTVLVSADGGRSWPDSPSR